MIGQSKNSSDAEMSTEDMSNKKKSKHLTGNNVKLKIRYHNNEKKKMYAVGCCNSFQFYQAICHAKSTKF